ncbi:MAG: DUF1553 domain-containing protein, partial [Planctomycetota bacterium]|nr:DUF1553 domain-containing protein [Planctomycetota bacterium]
KGLETRLNQLNQFVEKQRRLISQGARDRVAEYLMAVHYRRHHPSTENFMTLTEKGNVIPKIISRYENYLNEALNHHDPVWVIWHLYSKLVDDEFEEKAAQVSLQISKSHDLKINPIVAKVFTGFVPKTMEEVAQKYAQVFKQVMDDSENTDSPAILPLRDFLFAKKSPAVLPGVFGWGFLDLLPDRPTQAEYEKLLKAVENFCKTGPHAPPRAMVILDTDEVYQPFVFLRGNPNRKGPRVPRQFLTSIPNTEAIRTKFPANQSGRLQLANAIASPQNPLTARVIVNRVWQQHFGRGLVPTPSDFGIQGAQPSHPELLDWLASWFIKNGWSIKKLHKLIMLSATYQRSSQPNRSHDRDPENQFLARFNRTRLSFEAIRDSMIDATGQLEVKTGGKSFALFQGYTPRRTVYGFINRMDLPGILRTFDYPEPVATSGQREQTTVPAQALFFLNHEFVSRSAARILEREEIRNEKSTDKKLRKLYRILFARNPDRFEVLAGLRYLSEKKQLKPLPWKYGFGTFDLQKKTVSDFQELQYFTGTHWQAGSVLPDPKLNWVYHADDESHPGNSMNLCSIRRWIAPQSGKIEIRGFLKHEPSEGNGVRVRILYNQNRVLGSWQVHHSQETTNVKELSVRQGDTLDLLSDFNGNISHDQHQWSVTIKSISEEPGQHWNSKKDFRGPLTDRWQSYVHALLMTNEFIFVD